MLYLCKETASITASDMIKTFPIFPFSVYFEQNYKAKHCKAGCC